jgi:transcriptional regulator with XRE-family HTH domain
MPDDVAVFDIPKINLQPIPLHKRTDYRRNFGGELREHCRHSEVRTLKELASRAGVSAELVSKLVAGKDTSDHATMDRLERIANALSCELVLQNTEGEKNYDGATTTLEDLFRMGIWPTLEPCI